MRRPYFDPIWKKVGQAIGDYDLINDGDCIAIGLSGGKDSMVLTWVLSTLQKIAPVKFALEAVSIDLGWGDDLSGVGTHCESLGIRHTVKRTTIGPIAFKHKSSQSACALCAHLRRGALNDTAHELGCNKVALAHHLDDAIETLLMSMLYEGRIYCFHPKTYLDESKITVIRPLVYTEEVSVAAACRELGFPAVSNSCPAEGKTSRSEAKRMLQHLAAVVPNVRGQLRSCLQHFWKDA